MTIRIPRELYHRLADMIESTGFTSVTQFIVFVNQSSVASGGEMTKGDRLTDEEVKAVRERLRRLGYL